MHVSLKRLFVPGLFVLAAAGLSGGAARAQNAQKYPWMKPPGPIAGKWQTTCADEAGMVVEITVSGPQGSGEQAVGTIATLGDKAGARGYTQGETILKLTADDFGDWVGKLEWRSVSGEDRWDPIRFVATPDKLNATMTTDNCYKNMPRAQ